MQAFFAIRKERAGRIFGSLSQTREWFSENYDYSERRQKTDALEREKGGNVQLFPWKTEKVHRFSKI